MVFSLGNTPSFGSTTTTASFGFGTATSTPATRATGFGTTGGFTFGAPNQTASTGIPSFGLGSTTTTASTGFGFPSATATTAPSFGGFGGFGTTNTATTSSTGFGGFGSFGTTTSTAAPTFGFGSQPSSLGTGTTPSLFSGFGQTQPSTSTGLGGFGAFGAKPQTSGLGTFGGFGTTSTSLGGGGLNFGQGLGLGQTQPLGTQPQQVTAGIPTGAEAVFNSVYNCNVFGDERDQVLAKWNLLQALWGTGKGYYSQSVPPVEYTPQNVLCRFKAVGYSRKPGAETKDAIVAFTFNKKDQEIKSQESQLISSLGSILGNKPNLVITVDAVKPLSENRSLVLFYVQEKGQNGVVRRVPHADLVNYFLQPMQKQQLTTMSVDSVYPYLAPDAEQLKEYFDTPPAGIDARLWKQAQHDNPDPDKLLPVPIIGFNDVRWRARCQEQETKVHQAVLDRIAEDIADLQRRHSNTVAKIAEYKQRFVQLEHRVLKVLVKQEISRNIGVALRPEEEILRSQLEALQTQINMPTHFKGRLSELLSQMRMQRQEAAQREVERYSMDPAMQDDIKQYLMMEQNGMSHLIEIIQNDLVDLKIMKDGINKLLSSN
ncbi:nuclear pore complex protein Nup54 [Lycorma delicatula]|uniref:nuclear pore complex protein Nup54 n=1 Tax=Lycorma delicatula TaxID=130591 RepID=UPI003F510BB0